jgi:hypothetical protein
MANSPHLFEDLKLIDQGKQVDGIGAGLVIKGTGTFVMRIEDDDRETHTTKIPNSLCLPNLRVCLLSPQHWAQEAKAMGNKGEWEANRTWMENHWDKCVLLWRGGPFRRSIPHSPTTNTPSFHTAAASKTYRAYVATFEACEASFYRREHVLQLPGLREQPDPDEFIADKNIHLREIDDATKVRDNDDKTIRTSNVTGDLPPPTPEERRAIRAIRLLRATGDPDLRSFAAARSRRRSPSRRRRRPSRADAMALPPWTRFVRVAQVDGNTGRHPQEAGKGATTQVCRLPLRRDDQATLARQRICFIP